MIYNDLALFTSVAQHLSFSASAAQLGIPLSRVSRRIAELEDHLGTKLFERTTRQVRLTEEGRRLLDRCQDPVEALQDIAGFTDDTRVHKIRITASSLAARTTIGPKLLDYAQAHPDIKLELITSNANLDFFRDNIDLAFRLGPLNDSSLVARKLWDVPYSFCVGQALADELDLHDPITPEQLEKLPAIISRPPWFLDNGGEIRPANVVHDLDDLDLVQLAVQKGMGVAMLPSDLVIDGMQAVHLLGTGPVTRDMFAVYPSKRLLPERIRNLITSLAMA
ncbi:LysR family transcriptional regulator [Tropicibacter sp. R16_0]|uniref:LysR family transcriptional regulator n=1 Tax=Tropicibacter sp. R16_0 TaxID=2821102 RepID=UPI001ADB93E1|nr:LysR family transcriptional regulator [Tropicibacter sp. R16_0]MBO9451151.1 LysR family transcriptional regulator [Tropicibacter sp. R16_0]